MMKSHEMIQGWFNYPNVFNFLLSTIPDGGVFVECGAWLGKSSSYLCDQAKDRVNVFIVDSWKGSEDELETNHKLATITDIYDIFLDNMGSRKFTPIRKLSHEAAKEFEDNSCDVVYIDMQHTYDAVKLDIQCWYPKVKSGGYIAGHDYATYAPGVVQAVHEAFGQHNVTVMDDNSWIVKKII